MKKGAWSQAFVVLITILCVGAAIAYVTEPSAGAAGVEQPKVYRILVIAAFASAAAWFAYAFSGDPWARRQEQVKFAYFFVIGSFAILMIPPFVKSQAIGSEPLGIVSGCVTDADAAQLHCDPGQLPAPVTGQDGETGKVAESAGATPAAGTGPRPAHNQWLVNIGGALSPQSGTCTSTQPEACTLGSTGNRVNVTGGIVVPLPFVIIALFGGAISLSRRVPEIQKRSEADYVGTEAQPKIDMCQAREELVFQIMQFASAPLIAITAHQVIEPESQASAVALAFLAGFGSETILLMIRGVANGIQPKSLTPRATGTAGGVPGDAGDGSGPGSGPGSGVSGGVLGVDGQAAALRLGHGGSAPASEPVHIRLCVDDTGVEAGSLALSVDGRPAGVPNDGCVELELAPGEPHRIEAHGRRAGREVHGQLALTANDDDDGRPLQLALG